MLSKSTLLALLCCIVAINVSSALKAHQVNPNVIGASVSSNNVVYRTEDDTTVFSYTVTTTSKALGHFVIATECAPAGGLVSGQAWLDHTATADPYTGAFGFLYPLGQDAGTTQTYTLQFYGDVKFGSSSAIVKDEQSEFAVPNGNVVGPICGASSDAFNPSACSSTPASASVYCNSSLNGIPTNANFVNQEKIDGQCPNDFTLINYFRYQVGSTIGYTECTQTVQVYDNLPPQVSGVANTHITLQCTDPLPPVPNASAQDDCDPNPLLPAPCIELTNGSCPSNNFVLRTWTATDHCGNSQCVTQTIQYVDNTAPELHGVPANSKEECNAQNRNNPPSPPVVTATDACNCWSDPANIVSVQPARYPGDCDETYTFKVTYSATDCCSNTATKTWVYEVVDTTAPSLSYKDSNYQSGGTYSCDNVPTPPPVAVSDACTDHDIVPVFNQTRVDGSCLYAYTLIWTWTATDDCGNVGTLTETILIRDYTNPTFVLSSLPANATVECGHVPALADVQANDNCGLASLVPNEVRHDGSCPNEYVLVRTWTATDVCGNTNSYTQYITVIDTTATKFTNVPTLGPYECASQVPPILPPPAGLTWQTGTDALGCSYDATLGDFDNEFPGACANQKTIVRNYNLTDCSGNVDSVQITINVHDDHAPQFTIPADVTVECNNVPVAPTISATDNCDCDSVPCIPAILVERRINGSCPWSYTLQRTWTATDSCSNVNSQTQTITVQSTQAPTISDIPGPVTVECNAVPAVPPVTGHAECGGFVITTPADTIVNGSCSNAYVITHHWHIVDDCGLSNDYSQVVTVQDKVAPTLSGVPADISVSCENVPPPANVCASDDCNGVTISFSQTRNNLPACDSNHVYFVLTRTWTATDACGNSVSQSQHINVYDIVNPTFDGSPSDLSFDCTNVQIPSAPTASDTCTTATVTDHSVKVPGSCPGSYVWNKAFLATDFCGNTAWYNYTVTVSDSHAPTLANIPAARTDTCTAKASVAPTATDACDNSPSVTGPFDATISSTCPYSFVLNRTWTATDLCGLQTTGSQIITVVDNQPPQFDNPAPQDASDECTPPAAPTVTATGFCGDVATVVPSTSYNNGSCVYDYVLTRTWTATDACNNQNTQTQVITIKDKSAPTITGVPADAQYDCFAPAPPAVCASDNCAGVSLNYVQTTPSQTCAYSYTLVRTWTATDLCGHTTSQSQTITVVDSHAPTFVTPNPGDSTVSCFNGPINAPSANDNCGDAPTIVNHTWVEPGDCAYRYKVHVSFSAADACGLTSWFNYTITVTDSSQPSVSWAPAPPTDQTFTCGNVPTAPVPTVTDSCGGGAYTGPFDEIQSQSCDYVLTIKRTWVFTDTCHNDFNVSVTLTGVDSADPTFTNPPGDYSQSCSATLNTPTLTAKDSCQNPATVTGPVDQHVDGSCTDQYDVVRTWTATDICGRTQTFTQTVHIYDNQAPIITPPTEPSSVSNQCSVSPPSAATVSDNCDPNPWLYANQTEQDRTCPYRVTAVNHYYAHDRCGNPSQVDQPIQYIWNLPPSFSNTPNSLTVSCDAVPAVAGVTAQDGCGVPITPVYVQTRTDGSCSNSYTLNRTWTATDACGVSNQYTQIITVQDVSAPSLCGVPADLTAQCGFVPSPPQVTASDNCPGVTISYKETTVPGPNCCTYQLIRTWNATDACGNTVSHSQTITVIDKIPPMLVGVPPSISCAACPFTLDNPNVTAHKPALAYGFCVVPTWASSACHTVQNNEALTTINGVVYHFDTSSTFVTWYNGEAIFNAYLYDPSNNQYTLELTLTNATQFSNMPAGFQPVQELDSGCYPTYADPTLWTYYPHVSGFLSGNGISISFTDASHPSQWGLGASGKTTAFGGTVFANYVGNAGTATAEINIAVIADGATLGTQSCVFNHTLLPHFNCDDPIPVTLNTTVTNGSCPFDQTYVRTWCATDEAGNTVCGSQYIHVCDNSLPTISGVPASIDVDCADAIPVANASVSDTCDLSPSLWYNDTRHDGSCPFKYTISRVYTAVDSCGNRNSVTETINVHDNDNPVLTVPGPQTYECNNTQPFGSASATDACGIAADQPTFVDSTLAGPQNCPQSYTLKREFTATDECGNAVSQPSYINVIDTYAPVISNVPANVNLECKAPVPASNPTASDVCAGDITSSIVPTPVQTNTDCASLFSVTITYNVQDPCGNTAEPKSWTYTYYDDIAPTFDQVMPANVTVDCDKVPAVPTITASDACNSASVAFNTWNAPGSCSNNYYIYRQWTATDCAKNTQVWLQLITVVDVTNPTISPSSVANVDATCKAVPPPVDFCINDNCNGVSGVFTQTKTYSNGQSGLCDQYVLNRTLVATDACGNNAAVSYTVTVNDQTAPTCSNTADYSVSCDAFQAPPAPTCNDDCSTASVVGPIITTVDGSCTGSYSKIYSWYSDDACGNRQWSNTTVTVYDDKAPTATYIPPSQTLQCNTPEPTDQARGDDNCGTVTVHSSDSRTTPTCTGVYVLTRTWWFTDDCGNRSGDYTTVYTFIDNTNPAWDQSTLPANTTVQCDNVPAAATPTGTDNCDLNPQVSLNQWRVNGSCENSYTIFRQWTLTDCSNNAITYTQQINVIDTVNPTVTPAPASQTVQCHQVPAPPAICASDNCDGVQVNYNQVRANLPGALGTCQDQFTLTRTWQAVDQCGNSNSTSYVITVNDQTAPVCAPSSIQPVSYTCDNIGQPPSAPQCTDDCSGPHYNSITTTQPGGCVYNYTTFYNFEAYDDCGNSVWVNTSVNVYDNTAPHFLSVPPDATVECNQIPAVVTPTWADNCGTVSLVSFTEVPSQHGACQNYTITRTWVIEDQCGNQATAVQVLTVQDSTAPTWDQQTLPTDKTIECSDSYTPPTLTASDNCGSAPVVLTTTPGPGLQNCANSYSIVYTWTATDACGHSISHSITLNVIDDVKPSFSSTPTAVVNATCDKIPSPPNVCCSDNCNGTSLTYSQVRVNGSCDHQYTLVRTWTCTDICGNNAVATQTVNVYDNYIPTFDQPTPPDATFECVDTDTFIDMTATDTCSPAPVTKNYTVSPGGCSHNYSIVRQWTATDDCGNSQTVYQHVTVADTIPPTGHGNLSCYAVEVVGKDYVTVFDVTKNGNMFTASDSCSSVTISFVSCTSDLDSVPQVGPGCIYDAASDTLTLSSVMPNLNIDGRHYTVTVVATDECGHSITLTSSILVMYNQLTPGQPINTNYTCPKGPTTCPDQCACQTVDHYCTNSGNYGTLSFVGTSFVGGNTQFTYSLSAVSYPTLVQIAVDLSQYQVVSTSPAGAQLGYQYGSVLNGISWLNPSGSTFSFTLAGTVGSSGSASVFLGQGLATNDAVPTPFPTCNNIAVTAGPSGAPSFSGSQSVAGTVVISGCRFGDDRGFNFGLQDVIVALQDGSGNVLQRTSTDSTGAYSFNGLSSTSGLFVQIVEDGLLRGSSNTQFRSPRTFLAATVNIVYGYPTYGVAQPVSNPNFQLLLDDDADPFYSRKLNTHAFEGDAKPWYYWQHQVDGTGDKDFSSIAWSLIQSVASSSTCATFSSAPDLAGAAYNIAAGFGVFEPYDTVQTWMFAFANYITCTASNPTANDQAIALSFAQRINNANDLDR
jgi:hypothetical protein